MRSSRLAAIREHNGRAVHLVSNAHPSVERPPALRNAMTKAEQGFYDTLPLGGVAIWQEDWSVVGQLITHLRETGVDVAAYFSAHADMYEILHKQILITDVNETALRMMGTTDKTLLIGSMAAVLPHTIFSFPRWISAIARGERVYRGQNAIRRFDGGLCECLVATILPENLEDLKYLMVTVIDISEYKGGPGPTVQSTIEHASRVTAMGALTASIAHEVKNPLAAIVTNAGASRRWLRLPIPNLAEAEEAIDRVVDDAIRARDVVDRTLSFLKRAPSKATELDTVQIIRESILLIMRDLQQHEVSVDFFPEPELAPIFADQIQVQQVLTNLLLNAAQAMAATDQPRKVTLRVSNEEEDICIEVTDIGVGIAPEQLDCLFEPFYSTKTNGIGMGLAVSRACVEANGGRIWAKSKLGVGTSFYFTLPASARAH